MLVQEDMIRIDDDILRNSAENIETVVKYGEKVAASV